MPQARAMGRAPAAIRVRAFAEDLRANVDHACGGSARRPSL